MGTEARCRGFTLIELLVTISVFAFLMLLAAPSFTSWIQDAQVRTAAESLQNGL
ncbi:MAG: prepilin-type N-terminal cleavage/methylation domain-containing protein, partial [Pseudomonadota bacterium]|nr:prepilin-type N-terminal cleavage/methylation domain-containing protein [Pseudomonadota bacterium]